MEYFSIPLGAICQIADQLILFPSFFIEIPSIIFVFMLILVSDCYQEFMVIQKCELLC